MPWIHKDCGGEIKANFIGLDIQKNGDANNSPVYMELECDSCGDSWDYTQTEVWDIATWEIGNHE